MATNIIFIFIVIWTLIIILIIILLINTFEIKQLNHFPTYNYPLEEVYFEITNVKHISFCIVEYTAVVCFFKKPNNKHFIYRQYYFYDVKNKYNIGDKLYLNKEK